MTVFQLEMDLDSMSKSQQKIANYVMGSLQQIPYCTEEDIATAVNVSTATVSRFWQAIGFANLKAFKKHLLQNEHATPAHKMKKILNKMVHEEADVVQEMLDMASANIKVTSERVERDSFYKAVDVIQAARKVYVFGTGASISLIELLRFRLNRVGVEVEGMAGSGSELLESLVHAGQRDVVVMFGFVRRAPELTVLLEHAAVAGYTTLLITDLLVSDMLEQSDLVLQVDRGELEGFHSMAAPVALIDAIAVAVTKRLGETAFERLDRLHALRKKYASQLPK
ncbi:DNA-binding MurR/RpiR family transcriptional regulator [Paenibacillus endophyticus]|uniref:DNA-binding MurR/RpiR family transcriptional regulator n=1 Tax=Paenibacillus endophyticus TaxID=1294268 RepID=A0A7W5CE59_9BACL|nr:MurR/RpiR family transcriptional regulator [Paenibacillus endophyticus]MBB3156016.1 DNA-binding MurR/RpiR family transcriptional regulator [Paenibacillus endophyticus]